MIPTEGVPEEVFVADCRAKDVSYAECCKKDNEGIEALCERL